MLKKITMLLLLLWGQQHGFAQFAQAKLHATGLTCALCSKAIHQAIEQLPFVQKVSAQLKKSSFEISCKPGASVDPAQIRQAVEEAGFFVGALYLTRDAGSSALATNNPFKEGGHYFCVLESGGKGGGKTYQVLNEHFLTEKDYTKMKKSSLGTTLLRQPVSIEGSAVFYLKSL
ncbi:MAG: heavy-metal-associated domain-containing protein [Sphingomonadales bacterium]